MASSARPSAVLVPVTVQYLEQKVDVAVPAGVPVAELLPGLVAALGRLNADTATQGFRVVLPNGRELTQASSLTEQAVPAGTTLTLAPAGTDVGDARYDDLVEAIGTSVEAAQTPWRRSDSAHLSSYAAVGLFVVAALLVVRGGGGWLGAAALLVGASLLTVATAVVRGISASGATALALTVPLLTGAAAHALTPGHALGLPAVVAGAAVIAGGGAALLLPAPHRSAVSAPLTAGLALVVLGSLVAFAAVPPPRAAGAVAALLALFTLLAPWLGLAQLPARIEGLALVPTAATVDQPDVQRQVEGARAGVLAIRVAAALATIALTPLVATTIPGALLMGAIGIAAMLGTRSLYGRAEVLTGVLGGLLTTLVAGAVIATADPASLPWIAGLAVLIGGFVLASNVISVRLRPGLSRAADALHVVALMAVLPLTALLWEIF